MAPKKRSQTPRQQLGVTDPLLLSDHQNPTYVNPLRKNTTNNTDPALTAKQPHRRKARADPPSSSSSTAAVTAATTTTVLSSNATSLSPRALESPRSPIEGFAPSSHSRRESTSTMRTSSLSVDGGASTCTPTGRISKAKKGKRVHACEFPGCGKVFTRAEHKRRHELNHNPEALFPCTRPGCRKAFHRIDLLQRHQERHDLDGVADGSASHTSHISHVPVSSDLSSVISSVSVNSPSADRSGPRTSSGGMSIGSLVHPQTDFRYMGTPAFNTHPRTMSQFVPGFPSSDDSGMFYTPESSQSPVSEYYGRYHHRQSISSSSSVIAFDPNGASPLISGTIPGGWVPSSGPPNMLPSNVTDDGSYLSTIPYQYPSPTWMDTNGLSFEETYQMPLEYCQEIHQPVYLTL